MLKFNNQYNLLINELYKRPLPSKQVITRRYKQAINESNTPGHSDYNPTVVQSLIAALRDHMDNTHPYFGFLLRQMSIQITFDVPTMAVDDKRNLYINPDFMLEIGKGSVQLSDKGFKILDQNNPIAFVLAHEVYHIFNQTFDRKRGRQAIVLFDHDKRPIRLWNIATDYEMNYHLEHTYGLKPPEDGMLCGADGLTQFPVFFTGKRYMVKGSSAERLYTLMLKDAREIERIQKENPTLTPNLLAPADYKFKVGDKLMIKGSDPPDWQEVVSILPNGDYETKPVIQVPVFPIPIEVIKY